MFKKIKTAILVFAYMLFLGELFSQIFTRYFLVFDIEMLRYSLLLKKYSTANVFGFSHLPTKQIELMGVSVDINSRGLRDDEQGESHAEEIVFLGDSFTFGWGVEKRNIFESVLEKKIPSGSQILNAGHCNFNTEQSVDLFFKKSLDRNAKVVYLFYYLNDAEITQSVKKKHWWTHSRLVALLRSRLRYLVNPQTYNQYYKELYWGPGWQKAQQSILRINQWAMQNDKIFRVIILPDLHELTSYPFLDIHDKINSFLSENKINQYDLLPHFIGRENPQSLWVAQDDAHPNSKAHSIIAEALWPVLKKDIMK